MSKYIKAFETTPEYEAYIQGGGVILPNVSMAKDAPTTTYYSPWVAPKNIITYKASAKLPETRYPESDGLHTNRFSGKSGILTIISHTFENGVGTIEFNGDVTSIGNNAFYFCKFTSITIPNSVTSIGDYAFGDCWLQSITIPDSVTSIGMAAFMDCPSLTSITIPDNVISIDICVFQRCNKLASVTIGSGITNISQQAFMDCPSLTNITIPDNVTSIGSSAFKGCSGLTNITSNAITAPTIQSSTFQNVKTGGTLTVPSGSTGYNTWMGTGNYYLGKYGWTKVEQ